MIASDMKNVAQGFVFIQIIAISVIPFFGSKHEPDENASSVAVMSGTSITANTPVTTNTPVATSTPVIPSTSAVPTVTPTAMATAGSSAPTETSSASTSNLDDFTWAQGEYKFSSIAGYNKEMCTALSIKDKIVYCDYKDQGFAKIAKTWDGQKSYQTRDGDYWLDIGSFVPKENKETFDLTRIISKDGWDKCAVWGHNDLNNPQFESSPMSLVSEQIVCVNKNERKMVIFTSTEVWNPVSNVERNGDRCLNAKRIGSQQEFCISALASNNGYMIISTYVK